MKRGTKITVFVATMALTFGSLMAFVGPRHCGRGMHSDRFRNWQDHRTEAGCVDRSNTPTPQN